MTLPGTQITVGDGAGSRSPSADSGTAFMVGFSDRGPVDAPILVRSSVEASAKLGGRVSYGVLADALETFFKEGGTRAYIGRIVGPAPVVATKNLLATATPTLTVNAISPGAWANNLTVESVASSGSFTLTVKESGTTVEVSPLLADNTEAVAWAASSSYIRLVDLAQGDPTNQTVTLISGADDRVNVTATQVAAALNLFTDDLGPGQVSYPGATDGTTHLALASHAISRNRVAICDGTNTATTSTITAQGVAVRAGNNGRAALVYSEWGVIPGLTAGTTRTVPPSAYVSGLAARSDGTSGNPNLAIAGANGKCRYVVGLAQPSRSNADREALQTAGVNASIIESGVVTVYGNNTAANPATQPNWTDANNARLAMVIGARADAIAKRYVFSQLDGNGHKVAEFAGELQGMLLPLYQSGALFGASPDEAFVVDTSVNTEASLASGILKATISVRMSPAAERVEITITKVAASEAI